MLIIHVGARPGNTGSVNRFFLRGRRCFLMDTQNKLRIFTPEWIYAGISKWHSQLWRTIYHISFHISHLSLADRNEVRYLLWQVSAGVEGVLNDK